MAEAANCGADARTCGRTPATATADFTATPVAGTETGAGGKPAAGGDAATCANGAAAVIWADESRSIAACPTGADKLADAGSAAMDASRGSATASGALAGVRAGSSAKENRASCDSTATGSLGASNLTGGVVAITAGACTASITKGIAETISIGAEAAGGAPAMLSEGAAKTEASGAAATATTATTAGAPVKLCCSGSRGDTAPGSRGRAGRTRASTCGALLPRSNIAAYRTPARPGLTMARPGLIGRSALAGTGSGGSVRRASSPRSPAPAESSGNVNAANTITLPGRTLVSHRWPGRLRRSWGSTLSVRSIASASHISLVCVTNAPA